VPLGQVSRLANRGTLALEIIEARWGSNLGDVDMVRFEEIYGRAKT
jgi:hypothetical protein